MEAEKEFPWADERLGEGDPISTSIPNYSQKPAVSVSAPFLGNTNQVFRRFVIGEKLIPTPINIYGILYA